MISFLLTTRLLQPLIVTLQVPSRSLSVARSLTVLLRRRTGKMLLSPPRLWRLPAQVPENHCLNTRTLCPSSVL
ncbi:hypothetical protein DFH06DRAFT_1186014 [Mycena polygramma]|nr:hypothetical protein DFH06DRAFT_1186014 [Mycena polygramma]